MSSSPYPQNYGPSQQNYGPPQQNYGPPQQQNYGPPQQQNYGPPQQQNYGPPQQQNYGPPQQNYGPSQQQIDQIISTATPLLTQKIDPAHLLAQKAMPMPSPGMNPYTIAIIILVIIGVTISIYSTILWYFKKHCDGNNYYVNKINDTVTWFNETWWTWWMFYVPIPFLFPFLQLFTFVKYITCS
jgi:hypothetical protein